MKRPSVESTSPLSLSVGSVVFAMESRYKLNGKQDADTTISSPFSNVNKSRSYKTQGTEQET